MKTIKENTLQNNIFSDNISEEIKEMFNQLQIKE